ncbi:hypothetical protein [Bifidobacterium choloepi]|nr:hypothetical protein [Bifidobacterium choloepi]
MNHEKVRRKQDDLNEAIDFIHWKEGFYADVLAGRTVYYSNLVGE